MKKTNTQGIVIGILDVDELDKTVIQTFGNYTDMFTRLLSVVDSTLIFKSYPILQGMFPENIHECDAYLITGSKYSCYDSETWISQLKTFVVSCFENNKKLIGICFGHQLIAAALGGVVQKSDKGWGVGLTRSEILQPANWLIPYQKNLNLLVSHQDQVIKLPKQATNIASSDFCVHASYQIGPCVLSFQGHPEFTRKYLLHILNKRREIVGEAVYQCAINSLGSVDNPEHDDHELVAQWIMNFIVAGFSTEKK